MKALVLTKSNTIEIIERPKPQLAAGEALVKIKAAALNHRDQWIREGKYPGIQEGVILGSDGAGVVEAVADQKDQSWVGREVIINPNRNWGPNPAVQAASFNILGTPADGTFAEYLSISLDRLHPKPRHLSWAEAAAVPLGGLTAFRALFTHAQVKEGDNILINGIGGGVAQWAFLFAKAVGASVWVTSSSAQKLEEIERHGAAGGFNYQVENWAQEAKKAVGGFDVIIDSAGGNALNALLDAVKPGGSIVMYGATTGIPEGLNLRKIFWNQVRLQGSTMGNDEEFAEMTEFVEKQKLHPIMEAPVAFDQIIEAFDMMKAGKQFGKLAVTMA